MNVSHPYHSSPFYLHYSFVLSFFSSWLSVNVSSSLPTSSNNNHICVCVGGINGSMQCLYVVNGLLVYCPSHAPQGHPVLLHMCPFLHSRCSPDSQKVTVRLWQWQSVATCCDAYALTYPFLPYIHPVSVYTDSPIRAHWFIRLQFQIGISGRDRPKKGSNEKDIILIRQTSGEDDHNGFRFPPHSPSSFFIRRDQLFVHRAPLWPSLLLSLHPPMRFARVFPFHRGVVQSSTVCN